jgi:CTP:molybdopterin cytidylyltransferase MocA
MDAADTTCGGPYTPGMTVAAIILSATSEGALADTLGQPRVRRLADLAWSGGALPIVVVSPDPDGSVAAALAGSEAIHGSPAPPEAGPAGQMVRGSELAAAAVRDTTAFIIWPARMTWVGPETITSLIEAHGADPVALLRPAWHGDPGWPVLLPAVSLDALRAVAPDLMPPDVVLALTSALATRIVEVGDPGVAIDADTRFEDLPPYEGPPDPPSGHAHEWGADVVAEAGLVDPTP